MRGVVLSLIYFIKGKKNH